MTLQHIVSVKTHIIKLELRVSQTSWVLLGRWCIMVPAKTNMIALVLRLFCILKGVHIYLVHDKNQVHKS